MGVLPTIEAKKLAFENELDLVLISPQAAPPVAKILDYGKYKYEMIKKEKEAKKNQKIVELKEVWLSTTIDTNDMATKAKNAIKFLNEEDRVKVSIKLRGRQIARPEIGVKVMEEFYEMVKEHGSMEKRPNFEGRSISMIIVPIAKK